MKSSVRGILAATVAAAAIAIVPGSASAASIADYSCDMDLTVTTPMDNGSSGSFSASGTGQCALGDPTKTVPTTFSVSGTYRAQRCSLISVAQPSYLNLSGTLTMTPQGSGAMSTSVNISTYDIATMNGAHGTINLGSGQTGITSVSYDSGALGFVARCGGGDFFPEYDASFQQPPNKRPAGTRTTSLSGAEQSETSAGDPDGTGSAVIVADPGSSRVCFDIVHQNIDPTQAGHVHQGARGANGPPVVNLYSSTGTNGGISDCFPADMATIVGILDNPRNYYVQLHNYAYLLGVVRGQLGD